MTAAAVLRKVRRAYPSLFEELPKPKLKLVRDALIFAARLSSHDEVLTETEHDELLEKLSVGRPLSPGQRLRAYRVRQDLTQVQLAKRCGSTQGNLSAMESGRRSIGLQMARKLARALGCDFRQLV